MRCLKVGRVDHSMHHCERGAGAFYIPPLYAAIISWVVVVDEPASTVTIKCVVVVEEARHT